MAAQKSQAETVVLNLDTNIKDAADAALGALGKLEAQILASDKAINALDAELAVAKAALSSIPPDAVDAFRAQSAAVDKLSDRLSDALIKHGQLTALTGKLSAQNDNAAKSTKGLTGQLKGADSVIKQLSGGISVSTNRVTLFARALASAGPYAAALAIVVGLALVSVLSLAAGFSKAITSADHLRDELLDLRVAGVFWWDSQRANTAGALALQGSIDKLAGSTAVARDELVGYATQLRNSYFRGKQLDTALQGMAIAGAAGGSKLANQFLGLAQNARFFGQDLDKLTERFKKKFGAVAEARLLSLSVQFSKFKENIAYIFSGADIEPFLKALQSVLSLFGRNEKSGQLLYDTIKRMTEFAIGAFLRMGIFILRTYIAIRTNATAWAVLGFIFEGIVTAVKVGIVAIGVAFAALAVVIAGLVAVGGVAWAVIGRVGAAVYTAFKTITSAGRLYELGKSIVTGIVAGIKGAAGAIWDALKGAVGGAIDKVTGFLEAHSPARLPARVIGEPISTGIAMGVDTEAPAVAESTKAAVSGAVDYGARAAKSAPSVGMGNGGFAPAFSNCTFGGDLTETTLEGWLLKIYERNLVAGG